MTTRDAGAAKTNLDTNSEIDRISPPALRTWRPADHDGPRVAIRRRALRLCLAALKPREASDVGDRTILKSH
jgi:hypothetical protein